MLPLGVVIPTKNSMPYLPAHLANLATWIDLAQQVVVVDSFSTDGTPEFLRQHLRHPQVSFVSHPPGLYASWNHGIRQLATEFCYLSTVGDSITRPGLEHLVVAAADLGCDVLVSQPDFVNAAGQPISGPDWPMAEVLRRSHLAAPARLPAALVLATALTHSGGALTGSCASDVFRTATLQQRPFPVDFGTAGDGAWSLQNAIRIQWAVTPARITTFRCHPPTASAGEVKAGATTDRLAPLTQQAFTEWQAAQSAHSLPAAQQLSQLQELSADLADCSRRYQKLRKASWPWIVNPAAWRARTRRNRLETKLSGLTDKIFATQFACQGRRQLYPQTNGLHG